MTDQALDRFARQMANAVDQRILTSREASSIVAQVVFDRAGIEVICSRTRRRNVQRLRRAMRDGDGDRQP